MRKILSIASAHLFFGLIAIYIVIASAHSEAWPSYWRSQQLKPYVTHTSCPSAYSSFTYCIWFGGKKTLFFGDSSVLAFSRNANDRPLIIGAGSCPLIKGLIASFSQPECDKLSTTLAERVKNGELDQIRKWVIVHRSEYLLEISSDRYIELIRDFVNLIRSRVPDADLMLVMEPPSLNLNVTRCMSRQLNLHIESCAPSHSREYSERLRAVSSHLPFITIVEAEDSIFRHLPQDRLVSLYKDRVHITEEAAPMTYPTLARGSL